MLKLFRRVLFLNNTHSKVRVKEEVKGPFLVRGEVVYFVKLTVSFSPSATTRVMGGVKEVLY